MESTSSHSSCISRPASVSAGESSWAMHFASFLASPAHSSDQEMNRQGGGVSESSFCSGFSSSFDSFLSDDEDDHPFIASDQKDADDDQDDCLQDTACSSVAGPKVTSMHDMCLKSMVTMDAKEITSPKLAAAGASQEGTSGGFNNEKQVYECSDLRKKGLCLVPFSVLIDYLG